MKITKNSHNLGNYKPYKIDEGNLEGIEFYDGFYYTENLFCRIYAENRKISSWTLISIYIDDICYTYNIKQKKPFTQVGLQRLCTKFAKELNQSIENKSNEDYDRQLNISKKRILMFETKLNKFSWLSKLFNKREFEFYRNNLMFEKAREDILEKLKSGELK